MKKRVIAFLMIMTISFSLTACGSESKPKESETEAAEETTEETTEEIVEKELVITSIAGDWNCVGMSMDDNGTQVKTEDFESLMGMKIGDMCHLTAYGDGTVEMKMMDEMGSFVWTEEGGKYKLSFGDSEDQGGEVMTAEIKDNQLILVSESVSSSDGEEYKTITTCTFDYNGKQSKLIEGWDYEVSKEEVLAISNFMMGSPYVVVDGILYGCFGGAEYGKGTFSMAEIVPGELPELKEAKVIDERGRARYLVESDGYIYGSLNNEKIIKMKAGDTKYEIIYEGSCDYIQLVGDEIRFTDEEYKYCSIGLNGGEKTIVIDQADMYYPYALSNDMVVYQNDPDNESIHIYDLKTGNDYKLNDAVSYEPIIYGDYLYYYSSVDDENSILYRLDLYSGKIEESESTVNFNIFIMDDKLIIGGHGGIPVVNLEDWNTFKNVVAGIYTMYPQYSNGEICVGKYSDGEVFILNDFADTESKTKIGYNYVAQ